MLVLRALVPAVILLIGAHDARADKKVDWGEYLEKPGDRPLKHDTPVAHQDTTAKAKAPAAKAKPKAKAKAKAAKGKHR